MCKPSMGNINFQILLFPHHLASTRKLILWSSFASPSFYSVLLQYCQTQWATCTSITSKCSVARKVTFFSEVEYIASGDLLWRVHTHTHTHMHTHTHKDNCKISIMIIIILISHRAKPHPHLPPKIHYYYRASVQSHWWTTRFQKESPNFLHANISTFTVLKENHSKRGHVTLVPPPHLWTWWYSTV